MDNTQLLILIGTFWPVEGVVLAVVFSLLLRGIWRWVALFILPGLSQVPVFMYTEQLARNGNMLFVTLFGLMLFLLFVYYFVLVTVAVVFFIRSRQQTDKDD